jgi:hypothetical protein
MSAKGGPLAITATWREGVLAKAEVETFQKKFYEILARVAQGGIAKDADMSEL